MRLGGLKAMSKAARTTLALTCVECTAVAKVTIGANNEINAETLFHEHGWMLSLLTSPGVDPIELGPLCKECAKKIYPEGFLNVAAAHPGSKQS